MPARKSITGQTFGSLFVRSDEAFCKLPSGKLQRMCDCLCVCGNPAVVAYSNVTSGHTASCGCDIEEKLKNGLRFKHGHAYQGKKRSLTYHRWATMKQRCFDANHEQFKHYGAIGITVCEGWNHSYTSFLQDLGECPPGLEIDRWPNKFGSYTCGHCEECLRNGWTFNARWATRKQQMRNARTNLILTVRGVTACLSELCEVFQVPYKRIWTRLHRGWTVEDAFFAPKT